MSKYGRVFLMTLGMLLLATAAVYAAGGNDIEELTGGAEKVFLGLRGPTWVRASGVAIFAYTLWQACSGHATSGMTSIAVILLMLGGWFGAEAIADTIFTVGAVL